MFRFGLGLGLCAQWLRHDHVHAGILTICDLGLGEEKGWVGVGRGRCIPLSGLGMALVGIKEFIADSDLCLRLSSASGHRSHTVV